MKSETSFRVFFLKQHRKNSLKYIFFPSESVFLDFSFWPQGHCTTQNAHCSLILSPPLFANRVIKGGVPISHFLQCCWPAKPKTYLHHHENHHDHPHRHHPDHPDHDNDDRLHRHHHNQPAGLQTPPTRASSWQAAPPNVDRLQVFLNKGSPPSPTNVAVLFTLFKGGGGGRSKALEQKQNRNVDRLRVCLSNTIVELADQKEKQRQRLIRSWESFERGPAGVLALAAPGKEETAEVWKWWSITKSVFYNKDLPHKKDLFQKYPDYKRL